MSDDTKALAIVPVGEKGIVALGGGLQEEGRYEGDGGTYVIYNIDGEPLYAGEDYFLCVAKLPSGQFGLVKGSSSPEGYKNIERESRILRTLQTLANEIDAKADAASKKKPAYGAYFPNIVEVIDLDEGKIGLFIAFHPSIESYQQFQPLSVLTDGQRVDLQTIVWALGKFLKAMEFVHACGFSVSWVDNTNILLEPAQHGVFILDWTEAAENATPANITQDITDAARMAWSAAGGTETTPPPYDADVIVKEGHDQFVAFLQRLMSGDHADAGTEFEALYAMADAIWGRVPSRTPGKTQRPFHVFVTYPL